MHRLLAGGEIPQTGAGWAGLGWAGLGWAGLGWLLGTLIILDPAWTARAVAGGQLGRAGAA